MKQSLSPKMSVSILVPAGRTSQHQHQNTTCAGVERTNVSEMRKDLKHSSRNKQKGGSCWSQSHRTATQTEIYDTKEASCDKNNTSRNTSTTLYDDDATENVQLRLYLQTARRESTAPLPVLKVRRETGERTRVKESESKENAAEK